MSLPIFHSQYTAAQIEASIGKTPRIKASTRTWEIWDIATSAYVNTGVSIDTELFVDNTLTEAGYAADALVTGTQLGELGTQLGELGTQLDELGTQLYELGTQLDELGTQLDELRSRIDNAGITDEVKQALLQLAAKVAYIDADGQDYYDDLYDALYDTTWEITNTLTGCTTSNGISSIHKGDAYTATITASTGYTLTGATVSVTMGGTDITSTAYNNGTISIASVTGALVISITATAKTPLSISAVYTQSGTVYDTDSLDSLKSDLVVIATYLDNSTAVPPADYALSGSLAAGTSTITVTFREKTTTFSVTVTAVIYSLSNRVFNNDGPEDSNVSLLNTDSDFTIFVEAKFGTQLSSTQWTILKCMSPSSPWPGITAQRRSESSNYLQIQWMTKKTSTNDIAISSTFDGTLKIALVHSASSGSMTYYAKVGNNTVISGSLTDVYQQITQHLVFGSNSNGNSQWIGTMNSAIVYPAVLSQGRINAFLGDGV